MTFCTSVRGEWGGICPDCGQRLPALKPMEHGRPCEQASWERIGQMNLSNDQRGRARSRARGATGSRGITARQRHVASVVRKHGGNYAAAARELGVTQPTVQITMKRFEQQARGEA